jgi:hypothetical protein
MANIVSKLADLAAMINEEHRQAEAALREGLAHAKAAGDLLLQAKAQCPHGSWLPWLKANVNFSERTAQNYIRVAKRWDELVGSNPQHVADLTYRDAINVLAYREEGQASAAQLLVFDPPRPRLEEGERYLIAGRSKYGAALIEIDPHPDHSGYWVTRCSHLIDGCDTGFCEYCGRGVKLEGVVIDGQEIDMIELMFRSYGFEPGTEWFAEPARYPPIAAAWYREDQLAKMKDRNKDDDADDDAP